MEVRRFSADQYYKATPGQRLAVLQRALAVAEGRTRTRLRFGRDTLPAPVLRPLPTVAEGLPRAA
ncbi:MAG: hypothetical protein WCD35_02600 [Mycobacteriales bacterium]